MLLLVVSHVSHHVVHAASHHAVPALSDDSGFGLLFGLFWFGLWIAAPIVAKKRGSNSWPLFLLFGWILSPAAFLIAWLIPGQGQVAPPHTPDQVRLIGEQLARIESGNLPTIDPAGVMPQPGETFFWQQRAQYGQTQKQRVFNASTPALYVPLGHGFRARVGGIHGGSQNVQNFVWNGNGTVYVSNMRIIIKLDDGEIAQAPYPTILAYDAFENGLGLNVQGIGLMHFKTGDELLGKLFLKVVSDMTKPQPSESLQSLPETQT